MADVGVVKYKVELDDSDVGKQADKTESTLKSKLEIRNYTLISM